MIVYIEKFNSCEDVMLLTTSEFERKRNLKYICTTENLNVYEDRKTGIYFGITNEDLDKIWQEE